MKSFLKGQMVKVISIEEKTGTKGNFKVALFTVSDRIKRTVNAVQVSDFYLCKATGTRAELIEKYFNDKDETGKLISRKIDLYGHMETYTKAQKKEVKLNVKAKALLDAFGISAPDKEKLEVTLTKNESMDVTQYIFIVDEIEFADYKPKEEGEVKINLGGASTGPIVLNLDGGNNESPANGISELDKALSNLGLDSNASSAPGWVV